MSLLHPARVGAPVGVWFNGDHPDRIVHESERYRVISPAAPTRGGWSFRAIGDSGIIHGFVIEGSGDHWTLVRVDAADPLRWMTA